MVSVAQVLNEKKKKKKKAKTSFCRTSPAPSASASTLWRHQSALRHNGGAEGEKEASRAQQGKFSRNLTEETDYIYCFGSTHYNISVSVRWRFSMSTPEKLFLSFFLHLVSGCAEGAKAPHSGVLKRRFGLASCLGLPRLGGRNDMAPEVKISNINVSEYS